MYLAFQQVDGRAPSYRFYRAVIGPQLGRMTSPQVRADKKHNVHVTRLTNPPGACRSKVSAENRNEILAWHGHMWLM